MLMEIETLGMTFNTQTKQILKIRKRLEGGKEESTAMYLGESH